MNTGQFNTISRAEQALIDSPEIPLAGDWRKQFEAAADQYRIILSQLRLSGRLSRLFGFGEPVIYTLTEYMRSAHAVDGMDGIPIYFASLARNVGHDSIQDGVRQLMRQLAILVRTSEFVLAPAYLAHVTHLKALGEELIRVQGSIVALASLFGDLAIEGSGYAVEKPDWNDEQGRDLFLNPNHVARKLMQLLDRIPVFLPGLNENAPEPSTSAYGLAQRGLANAVTSIENGVLGIMREEWGLQRLTASPGQALDEATMRPTGTIVTNDIRLLGRVAQVTKYGYTYNGSRIFRLTEVLIYNQQS